MRIRQPPSAAIMECSPQRQPFRQVFECEHANESLAVHHEQRARPGFETLQRWFERLVRIGAGVRRLRELSH
jgi:hypothetical protein